MSRSIEEALADCLARMEEDEATLEEALRPYSELRTELEPILALSVELGSMPKVEAPASLRGHKRPVFHPYRPQRAEGWWRRWLPASGPSLAWSAPLARAAAALALVAMVSGGAIVASANSLPDEPLYSVKLAVENAELAFSPNELARANLELKFAEKRLKEVEVAAQQGRIEAVARGAELYKEKADAAARAASASGSDEVQDTLRNNIEVLTAVQDKVQNPRAKEAIGAAIERAEDRAGGSKESEEKNPNNNGPKPEKESPRAVVVSTATVTTAATATLPPASTPTATLTVTPEATAANEPPGKATGRPDQPGNSSPPEGQATPPTKGQGPAIQDNPSQEPKGQGSPPKDTSPKPTVAATPSVQEIQTATRGQVADDKAVNDPPSKGNPPGKTQDNSQGRDQDSSQGKDKKSSNTPEQGKDLLSEVLHNLQRLIGRS